MAAALSRVPEVEIDGGGVFKYVLVRVRAADGPGKDVVRGHGWAEYHADLFERTAEELAQQGLVCECLGGGRVSHRPEERKIHVYGYSVVSRGRRGGGTPPWARLLPPGGGTSPRSAPAAHGPTGTASLGSRRHRCCRPALGVAVSPRRPSACTPTPAFPASGWHRAPARVLLASGSRSRLSCPPLSRCRPGAGAEWSLTDTGAAASAAAGALGCVEPPQGFAELSRGS
ncbi:14 kDa phosphohistidine phosphatase isoform 1-T1 [Alca torda]